MWLKLIWNTRFREKKQRAEEGRDFWTSVEMAYRRVAKTCNFIALSSISCIKSRKNRKLSENSLWFGLKISLLSPIIFFLFFSYLKPAYICILMLHAMSGITFQAFNFFQSVKVHNTLLDQEIQILRFCWKWKKCGNQNFTGEEKYIFYIQKAKYQGADRNENITRNWNKYLHK